MLTQPQIDTVWQSKMTAEARANYFGDLASRESFIKRVLTFVSFIGSSSAFVTILVKHPNIAAAQALLVAIANGYSIAINQDSRIKTLGKLHLQWLQLEHSYDRLWSHTYDEDPESALDECLRREVDLSETAATEVNHNEKRWVKWLDIVHKKHDTQWHAQVERDPGQLASQPQEGTTNATTT